MTLIYVQTMRVKDLTVPFEDTILPSTYFNSCNSEGTVCTFQVDMTNESVGGGDGECGVHIGVTLIFLIGGQMS